MHNRPPRRSRWVDSQKGQVLIIFALTAVVLFAIMGLAVDAGISYLHSDQQEKAAEAAALTGVAYLPGDITDAKADAILTAQRDGYTVGGTGGSAVTVSVTQPTGTDNQLEVAITAPAPVYFLELLGFGEHEVTASAVAEYLPPIQLGQPGNQLGTTMGSATGDLGDGGYYFLRSIGWGDPRSEGDPFTPTPDDATSACGSGGNQSCSATAHPDVHQISCIDGDDLCDNDANGSSNTDCGTANNLCLNDTGGQNYLIYVPAGTTAGVSVYNPSFDPGNDTNCSGQTASCLDTFHEDDGSFPALSGITSTGDAPASDYDSMGFTLFAAPELNNRLADIPLVQDVFCPFDAYDLDTGTKSYSYYEEENGSTADACNPVDAGSTTSSTAAKLASVNGTPAVYNQPPNGTAVASGANGGYTSLNSYDPSGANADLFTQTYNALKSESGTYTTEVGGSYYLYGGTSGQYFRLRVDTLAWNGFVINSSTSTNSPSTDSASLPDSYPLGHNGYSLEVTSPSGATGTACSTTTCTISAMADMTIYTPINGSKATSFDVPLFDLPAEYAGQEITVSAFDPGDVGNGSAYLGILQPAYTSTTGTSHPLEFATLGTASGGGPSVYDVGDTLDSGSSTAVAVNDGANPNGYTETSKSAIVETATTSGASNFNGQWVQFTIQVPSDYNPTSSTSSYWDLYYQVASSAYAGDTLAFEVQYLGSPVHLIS